VNKQTTELRFGEVQFRQNAKALWIPREAVVTLDVNGQLFRNTHHYSHYKLFNVKAKETQAAPEPTPPTSPSPE
jgi:hypothetical protein